MEAASPPLVIHCGAQGAHHPTASFGAAGAKGLGDGAILPLGHECKLYRRLKQAALPPGAFLRASRSALIRVDRVKELASAASGPPARELTDGTRIGLTRGWREIHSALCYQ